MAFETEYHKGDKVLVNGQEAWVVSHKSEFGRRGPQEVYTLVDQNGNEFEAAESEISGKFARVSMRELMK